MRTLPVIAAALPLLVAAPLGAQSASSASYALEVESLAGAAGGCSSPGFAAHLQLHAPAGGVVASSSYEAEFGFLAGVDPAPTNAPVVFGVSPHLGPKAGGTTVTLAGVNLDVLGSGASLAVSVGGTPASGVTVLSDTQATAVVPPGPHGPADVLVQGAYGADVAPGGYVYTPAVLSSPSAMVGGTLEVVNAGPVGSLFTTFWATTTTSFPLPGFGTLLIGPLGIEPLLPSQPYPLPDGEAVATLPIPDQPVLAGLAVHFQSVRIAFPVFELTNRATTVLK